MKSIHLTIPETWNQLSTTQIKNICYTIFCTQRSIVNIPEQTLTVQSAAYIKCAKELLRGNSYKSLRIALKEIQVQAYKPFVKFLFQEVTLHKFPETFTFKTTLHAPAIRLRNLTIEEFSFADSLYFRFKTQNQVKYLNLLCATLYREATTGSNKTDIRQAYNRQLVEENYNYFNDLSIKEKLPVLFAYEGSRNHLVSLYPNVFPKSNTTPNPKSKPKYVPFGELISSKIEYDPSKLEAANKTNAYTFFSIYENELKQIKKLKRKK